MTDQQIHSILGVGFGPANLSLAVTLEELGYTGGARYVERADGFQWQDEQLLAGADIQNNPVPRPHHAAQHRQCLHLRQLPRRAGPG
ncbi:hypothetical protein GCM10020221_12850 [Streptomyces thioluteus]|uniref:L-lysine N6-monooxygenase MbtG n=1 Tax=Streptomyces thioluteus TaxID=66431 RepID=A0ABN3WKT0_STRTU